MNEKLFREVFDKIQTGTAVSGEEIALAHLVNRLVDGVIIDDVNYTIKAGDVLSGDATLSITEVKRILGPQTLDTLKEQYEAFSQKTREELAVQLTRTQESMNFRYSSEKETVEAQLKSFKKAKSVLTRLNTPKYSDIQALANDSNEAVLQSIEVLTKALDEMTSPETLSLSDYIKGIGEEYESKIKFLEDYLTRTELLLDPSALTDKINLIVRLIKRK